MRGDGRTYRKRGSRFLHMEYWVDGEPIRGSTGEEDPDKAEAKLQRERDKARRGDVVPHEDRLKLVDLFRLLEDNYKLRRNRSLETMPYSFNHLFRFFGDHAKAIKLGNRVDEYIAARREEGAADASIRIELALLDRAFELAVRKKRLSKHSRPYIEKPSEDPSRVRKGFLSREQVERLSQKLPAPIGDLVLFLFFSAWRVGEARTLEWRDYFKDEGAIRLRAERSKNGHARLLPITGELATIMDRRVKARRLDCPYIFHQEGRQIGDFRKVWKRACAEIGVSGRIVHDLRRSGVKHLIDSGIDPHTVMAFSGHRTDSMLKRYHIIDLDDLRRAAERASAYAGPRNSVAKLPGSTDTWAEQTRTEPAQENVKSRVLVDGGEARS